MIKEFSVAKFTKKEHQHFIPKAYLKNFATQKENKYFVEAKSIEEVYPKEKLLSINDICVQKNVYTTPTVEDESKYHLENFYAYNIENNYTTIYKYLVNPIVLRTTSIGKRNILFCLMHLYFRTPKFLNSQNIKSNHFFDDLAIRNADTNGIVPIEYFGQKGYFHVDQIENLKEHQRQINKITFLQNNFAGLKKFIDENQNARIAVYKIAEEVNLISSDNPVVMGSSNGLEFNVFDKSNIISVPLDSKHFLKIFLNEDLNENLEIFREDRDKWFAYTLNQSVEDNCEKWIYGKEGTIKQHLKNKEEIILGSELKIVEYEKQLEIMKPVCEFIEKNGFLSEVTVNYIKSYLGNPIYKNNTWFLNIFRDITEKRQNLDNNAFDS